MRVVVTSTLIESVIYDEDSKFLRLNLTDGQVREFGDVPQNVVLGLTLAASPGQFYVKMIRGKYPRL
jgi:hypothetical protein